MAKKGPLPLTKDEIEEELLLNDNLFEDAGRNQGQLHSMTKNEKKNHVKGLTQSLEGFPKQSGGQSSSLSNEAFPSLPAPGKRASENRLKLPRKSGTPPIRKAVEERPSINLDLSNDDEYEAVFSLPNCISDGAPPLVSHRKIKSTKDPYFKMKHETDRVAFKRMVSHHIKWKESYLAEINRVKSQAFQKETRHERDIEREPSKSYKFEEKENDPFTYVSDSPKGSPKPFVDQRKGETWSGSGTLPHMNNQQGQRKTNRDSDCEEIEPILKNEEPKGVVSDWKTAPRSKRNRKQLHRDVRPEPEGSPVVVFDFNNQWDPSSSHWRGPSSSQPLSPNQVVEEKVQCPICQKDFALSKVENHAATCEGYSDSPMDVEEEN